MMLCEIIAWIFASGCWLNPPSKPNASKAVAQRELGLSYRSQGQYSQAIAAFKTATELDPANHAGLVGLGWTQHLVGQEKQATETLLRSAYQDPFNVPTLNALGIVLLVSGYLDDSVMVHSWALSLKPDNEIATYNLSLAYHRLQKYDWAIASAQQATKLEPNNPHPWIALAIGYHAKGDRDSAQQAYQQALRLDSRYGDLRFLEHLREAGFHPSQIQATERVFKLIL